MQKLSCKKKKPKEENKKVHYRDEILPGGMSTSEGVEINYKKLPMQIMKIQMGLCKFSLL